MGKSIDLIFVSNCTSSVLWQMTSNAIRSAVRNAKVKVGQVLIIEQCRHAPEFPIGRTVHYNFEFNYNECLNLGLHLLKEPSDYIAFCNNDLYFHESWGVNLIKAMEKYGYLSASPYDSRSSFQGVREGYTIGKTLLGWCIVAHRSVFDKIGRFDTPVRFWYSDNVYATQLKCAGIKHCLVGTSRVRHLRSVTLRKVPARTRIELMKKQERKFLKYKADKYAIASAKIEAEESSSN